LLTSGGVASACPVSTAALHYAHRIIFIHLYDPSRLACLSSLGTASVVVQLRPSNEITDDPSQLAHFLFRGWGLIDLPLRASDEHILIVRVPRAGAGLIGFSYSYTLPDGAPRCSSLCRQEGLSNFSISPEGAGRLFFTERIERAHFYCALCEQEERSACSFVSF
jgi:hypothetical protein